METGLSSSIGGMQRAMQTHAGRADRIAKASVDETGESDMTKDLAEMQTDPAMLKANAAAVKTQDQMLGALLDMFA